ncbi:chromosome replication initiation and membrane attachment protein [Williamsoniiplasma luminosum]|uniref:Chromosome replication initiation and membrane attachment protein n=1 Tax=Williamsoniiplasma luminosum TaxID=214888 RepID=A0A2K8NWR3_9MOLU|nr:DnaD domain protein [Williamsoniiplasma luminosum]ATZ17063.1 chromosome replication initiation and membrane attachment protein [Williamsoniiplasma luminosum]
MEKTPIKYSIDLKDSDVLVQQQDLITLYQPIIGSSAVGLYFSLFNEYHILKKLKLKLEHSRLTKISGLTEKQFNEDIKKLESLRLIKTLISKNGESVIYQIFAPLDINEFFENEMFEQTLTKKVGLENLEIIKFINQEVESKKVSDAEYEEVTAVFEDVFADEIDEMEKNPTIRDMNFVVLKQKKTTLFDKFINIEILNKILIDNGVAIDLRSKRYQKMFCDALTKQNFTEKTLATLIIGSFNFETAKIEPELFETKLNKTIAKKIRKETKAMESNLSDTQLEIVNLMDELNPDEYVLKVTNFIADFSTRRMINTLKEKFSLLNGAINCMIQHSINRNNKIIPNYIYKIAESLNSYSIKKTTDVLAYLNFFQKESSNNGMIQEELVSTRLTNSDEELMALFD